MQDLLDVMSMSAAWIKIINLSSVGFFFFLIKVVCSNGHVMFCWACVSSLHGCKMEVLKDDVCCSQQTHPSPPNRHFQSFLAPPPPHLNCPRRDSRKLRWRCTSMHVCWGVVVLAGQNSSLKWWKNVFLFFSFGLEGNPIHLSHISWPHPVLKIRLQTQVWVIDYPDCGLLGYLILQILRQNRED